jgi:hypothetical protein
VVLHQIGSLATSLDVFGAKRANYAIISFPACKLVYKLSFWVWMAQHAALDHQSFCTSEKTGSLTTSSCFGGKVRWYRFIFVISADSPLIFRTDLMKHSTEHQVLDWMDIVCTRFLELLDSFISNCLQYCSASKGRNKPAIQGLFQSDMD